MRWSVVVIAVLVVPSPVRAERFVCPSVITASPVWIDPGPRLRVHVAVLHVESSELRSSPPLGALRDEAAQLRSSRPFGALRDEAAQLRSSRPFGALRDEAAQLRSSRPFGALRDEAAQLVHDGQTYMLDAGLAERVADDFGAFAPLALRLIEQRLQGLEGPQRDRRVQRVALLALSHLHRHLPYRVKPHVQLVQNTELWVHRLAAMVRRRLGHVLTITSGTRTPEQQAAAMYGKLVRGGRYRSLYKKRELAEQIRQTFRTARRRGKRRGEIVAAMTATIEEQLRQGLQISAHLKRVAVDVRSYDMTRRVKRTFRRLTESIEGMRLLNEERRPPHFHLEVPGAAAVPGCPQLEVREPSSMPASAPASRPIMPVENCRPPN